MKITIVIHPRQAHTLEQNYILWALRDVWSDRGWDVVTAHGVSDPIDADLVIPHLDVTRIPEEYARFFAACPQVVNRRARDISKRKVSSNLVGAGDAYRGPVIVKTDRNCGGQTDWQLELATGQRPFGGKAGSVGQTRSQREGASGLNGLAFARILDTSSYPVFDSLDDIPEGVFDNEALVVEKFLPEREGPHYCLRVYTFFGNRHYNMRVKAEDPIVKASKVIHKEEVPVPEEIVAARNRMGLDFGKIDYVVQEGSPVVLDANWTPTFAGRELTEEQRGRAEFMAEGIEAWLRRSGEIR